MDAVVFDWDGTLVDSQTAYVASWKNTLQAHGFDSAEKYLRYTIGRAFPDCLAYFMALHSVDPEQFEADWRLDFRNRVSSELTLYPDAVQCARACVENAIPVAIATQTPRGEFERAVDITGLRDISKVTVCRDEVERPKPAPDLYLEACKRLQIDPAKCLAVEDSVVGATSARSAGLTVVGIARSVASEAELDGAADVVVTELDCFDLLALVRDRI